MSLAGFFSFGVRCGVAAAAPPAPRRTPATIRNGEYGESYLLLIRLSFAQAQHNQRKLVVALRSRTPLVELLDFCNIYYHKRVHKIDNDAKRENQLCMKERKLTYTSIK